MALRTLLIDHVVPHVANDLRLEEDAFSLVMKDRRVLAVLRKYEPQLRSIYACYSGVDLSIGASGTLNTMNIKEMGDTCTDCGLFDSPEFGKLDMIAAFVRVNIDDELYEQHEPCNSPTELEFDEFCEMVARAWNGIVWSRLPSEKRETGDVALALQSWLCETFLPRALGSVATRMKEMRRLREARQRKAKQKNGVQAAAAVGAD